jgi:C1A family cysteine protease
MKSLILLIVVFVCLSGSVIAINNLDFRLDTPEKGFYPNEKIPLNVSLTNRDTSFTSKDISLIITIGDRMYTYDVGDLEPSETYQKQILLPKFPAGTHTIKGEANYTGILDEQFTEVTYGSFEVLFPPIERYPRNVYISNYDLPEKILSGKTYDVSITIKNDGEVSADLLIEFGSIDEFFSETTTLNSQETTTVKMSVKYQNPGVSLIEARAYAIINGEKYLLNYRGKKTFVQDVKIANLSFDRIEYIDEADNAINQNDHVKFKVYIKNSGDAATQAKAVIYTLQKGVNITKSEVNYELVVRGDSYAPAGDFYEIDTQNAEEGNNTLIMKLNYIDSELRTKELSIPINIKKDDVCGDFDNDSYDAKICADSDAKPNTDCNDYDAQINPGTKDVCDGINNDCDDKIDEDAICGSKKSCVNGACCFDVNSNGACDDKVSCDISCTPDCEIPNKFDWRDTDGPDQNDINENWMTPVKNQGNCGSCWAFGAVGTYEANYKIKTKDSTFNIDLSEQQLTSNSGDCCFMCGDCNGGSAVGAFMYIKDKSIGTENCFPYTASTVECNLCSEYRSNTYTLTNYERVPADFQSIKRALICKGPLSVGSNTWSHAIVLVGYDDESQNWVIKNSWGTWWGSGGYGKISYEGDAHSDIINRAYYIEGLTKK